MDTFTAGRYSPHGMNGVDHETCIHGQDKTSPQKHTHTRMAAATHTGYSIVHSGLQLQAGSFHTPRTHRHGSVLQARLTSFSQHQHTLSALNTSRQHLASQRTEQDPYCSHQKRPYYYSKCVWDRSRPQPPRWRAAAPQAGRIWHNGHITLRLQRGTHAKQMALA